jgi:DNA polymerase/3'-5' exonuclease PolX
MYKLLDAKLHASEFMKFINPFCEKQFLAGSILRGCSMVNDIDIIVIPKFEQQEDETLFGEPIQVDLLEKKLSDMAFNDELKIIKNGDKIKSFTQFLDSPIQIDIYFANPKTWITTCLIRTGSKEHNIKLCMRARELGFQLKADGTGLLDAQFKIIPIESELELFNHLKLPFKEAEER